MKKWTKNPLIMLLAALLLVAVFAGMPPIGPLSRSATMLLGIFAASVLLWIVVGIEWPSLFCLFLLSLLPEISMSSLMTTSFGNPTICFLIFTFCCSHAVHNTPFIRRCAIGFLSLPISRKGPWYFLTTYFLSVLLLGSCMSTTVIVMIYLTINEEIFRILNLKKGDPLAVMMTAGLIIAASISGAITPIAHVFPLMAMSVYESIVGQSIGYGAYMAAGIPAGLVSLAGTMLIFRFLLKPDTARISEIDISAMKRSLPKADAREKLTVAIFFTIVFFWVAPDLLKGVFPTVCKAISAYGTVTPPLIGMILLCVISIDGKPLLKMSEGMKAVPWPCIFMGGAALALGGAMTNGDIGLSEAVKQAIAPLAGRLSGFSLVALLVIVTALLTNVGSNMVTVTIVSAVGLPIAVGLGGSVNPAAFAAVIGMMSTYAWATPPAMTTVVLGTGTGWATAADMAKYGFLALVPSVLAVLFIAYPIACSLM